MMPWATILRLICLLSAAMVLGCVTSDKPLFTNHTENAEELRAEIEAVCEKWRKAMLEDRDLLKVASFYADNGLIVDANGLYMTGREAIDNYWSDLPSASDWTLTTYFVDGRNGLIVQRGRSDLTLNINGQDQTSSVEFTHLWQRQTDDTLKIVVDGYWRLEEGIGSRE